MAELNKKYSYQSWKRKTFVDVDAKEFNDSEIIGACFYQDTPYSNVFPPDIEDVVFERCNLDNVNIPAGATVKGGTNQHIATMNDGEYWIVGIDGKPIVPRDAAKFDECRLSKDPRDIPATMVAVPVTMTYDPKRIEAAKIEALKNDEARLKQVLIDSRELTAGVKP